MKTKVNPSPDAREMIADIRGLLELIYNHGDFRNGNTHMGIDEGEVLTGRFCDHIAAKYGLNTQDIYTRNDLVMILKQSKVREGLFEEVSRDLKITESKVRHLEGKIALYRTVIMGDFGDADVSIGPRYCEDIVDTAVMSKLSLLKDLERRNRS